MWRHLNEVTRCQVAYSLSFAGYCELSHASHKIVISLLQWCEVHVVIMKSISMVVLNGFVGPICVELQWSFKHARTAALHGGSCDDKVYF